MDDEGSDNGISGWAGFMLGRMSAQRSVRSVAIAQTISARLRGEVPVDVGSLQNEIWRLRNVVANKDSHIAKLNSYIDSCEQNYKRLDKWAVEAERLNTQLRAKLKENGID